MKKCRRNDLCWCGSGKKYKNCHYRRNNNLTIPKSEAINGWYKLINVKECLHPRANDKSCKGQIIRAHTVQNSGQLSKIERNGHVYGNIFSLGALFPKFDLIGINNASTFTGFCQKHDTEIFRDIETQPITLTQKQLFLLGYRAICMEYYKKKALLKAPESIRGFAKSKHWLARMFTKLMANVLETGNKMGYKDMELAKKEFDSVLVNVSYDRIRYAIIEFDKAPEVMASGAFLIVKDFSGTKLQDLSQKDRLTPITFSLISTDTGGAAVFVWIAQNGPVFINFINSLFDLGNEHIPHAILRMTFNMIENIFVSPVWWEQLSGTDQKHFLTRLRLIGRRGSDYSDDGERVIDWSITNMSTKYGEG